MDRNGGDLATALLAVFGVAVFLLGIWYYDWRAAMIATGIVLVVEAVSLRS